MKTKLRTLALSLLLSLQAVAQPSSISGPYQLTLSKINAALVGGASTVKDIEFTNDGSALEDSAKSQIFSDGNAGSIVIGAPAGKLILLKGGGSQKFYTGNAGVVAVDSFLANKNIYMNGAGTATSTLTSMWSDAAAGNLFANVPAGKYEQHRVAGAGLLSLGQAAGSTSAYNWSIGYYGSALTANAAYSGIYAASSMVLNVPASQVYQLAVNGIEKYRFSAALAEFDRLSLGGTIGSSTDGGIGSLALTNRIQFAGAGTADSTKSLIYASAADGDISIAVPSAKFMRGVVGGTQKWYADSTGFGVNGNSIMVTTSQSPASNGTGTAGQIAWDVNYIYVCTSANTWKRAALTGGY